MPRISVLIPCFNHGQWIDEAVESVFSQTYQDFEIVIVDDGSTDEGTRRKLAAYGRPRTRVVRTENRGLPAARNTAAALAEGEIFCALDADDRLASAWLEKGLAVLDAEPSVAFVSHWLQTFGDEQWTWKPGACDLPALLARNAVNGAALVRRDAFNAVGGFDESMRHGCEDWDFWLRLVECGYRGVIIPEVLYFYRRTKDSMSRVMTSTDAYRVPLETLVRKHESAFRAHAVDVLVAKELETLALLREVHGLERGHLCETMPAIARAREEAQALGSTVARARPLVAAREDRERLAHEVNELRREVRDLRRSWSWRLTAPLRAVVGRWRGEGR